MKKLILLTFLLIGAVSFSQAQSLIYQVTNTTSGATSDTWKVKLIDAGPSSAVNLTLAPSTTATGSIPSAALPVKVIASSTNGCYVAPTSISIVTNPTSVTITDNCGNNHEAKIAKLSNGNYGLKLKFN